MRHRLSRMTGFVRFLGVFALTAVIALAITGCGRSSDKSAPDSGEEATIPSSSTAEPIQSGVSHQMLEFDGLERTYRQFVPSGVVEGTRLPLVVGLHGGLGSGDQFAAASNFETLAQSSGFVVVFPDGVDKTWNAGTCCGQAVKKNTDDVGFLAALITELTKTLPVDADRVFVAGHSNGAMMAFRFGCERADLVKAIAPVAGSLEIPECNPSRGVSLLAIHGDADQNHPIEGGVGSRSVAGVSYRSMQDTLTMWTKAMGCDGNPGQSVDGALTTTTWKGCVDGARAEFVVIAGADHPWPGRQAGLPGRSAEPSQELDATKAVWDFFESLP